MKRRALIGLPSIKKHNPRTCFWWKWFSLVYYGWKLFLCVSHFWIQFPLVLPVEKVSTNFPSRNSIRLSSNAINWFSWTYFQSKGFPRIFDRWNQINRFFMQRFLEEFPITKICSQVFPINEKCLLSFPVNKKFFYELPLLEIDFMAFLYMKSTSMVFASIKLIYIDFQSTSFF